MRTEKAMRLRCSEIRDSFQKNPVETSVLALFRQSQALQPLWKLATETWAAGLKTPEDKLATHVAAIEGAFQRMEDWRTKRSKMVRKDEQAISSAISYFRNGAHGREVRSLLLSPVARNAAGTLRTCLHLASFNYEDTQVPTIIAGEIFNLAAVRTLYPIDTDNLVRYAPDSIHGEGGNIDNFNAMLEIGSQDLGLNVELEHLNAEAKRLWSDFNVVRSIEWPTALLVEEAGTSNSALYLKSLREFHDRPLE